MILAIDTSVGISVAVHDGTEILSEVTATEYGLQGELTSQFISTALSAAQITMNDIRNIVVGVGPGPFTGLRVGITTALTLSYALNVPVHGLCSLDALGSHVVGEGIVVTDARRKELYWARYVDGVRCDGPSVDKPEAIVTRYPSTPICGPGSQLYPNVVSGTVMQIQAGALAEMFTQGKGQIHEVVPMYLRKPDAVEPGKRKQVIS